MTSMGSLSPPPQVKKTLAGKIAFRTALFGVGAFVASVGYVHFRRISDQDVRSL